MQLKLIPSFMRNLFADYERVAGVAVDLSQ